MEKQILRDYLEKQAIPVVIRKKKSYLTYEGIPDRYVYILKKGIIKTSVVTHEGREFNLRYLTDFEFVSLTNPLKKSKPLLMCGLNQKKPNYTKSCGINFGQMSIVIACCRIMSKSIIEET